MNESIKKDLLQLLHNLQEQKINETILNIFSIKRSTHYNNNLMIVGRYITGAHPDCVFERTESITKSNTLIEMLAYHESAMNWVSDFEDPKRNLAPNEKPFSTRRLPFWRVARQVALQGKLTTDVCWSDQTAWTNLYKISKNGGHPSSTLRTYQFDVAKRILLQEIADAKPKNILFLTGWDNWAKPFIEDHLQDCTYINKNNVILTGTLHLDLETCTVVVADNPYKTDEKAMAETIIASIKK